MLVLLRQQQGERVGRGQGHRAHLVTELLDWDVVPPTVQREGPPGEGMAQLWQEPDPAQDVVVSFPEEGWRAVLESE